MNKVVAIDIDDTINNFSEVLKSLEVDYNTYAHLDKKTFNRWLRLVKRGSFEGEDKDKKFWSFYHSIHRQCYSLATANEKAIKFIQWLKQNNWRIIMLTYRDLRYCINDTKLWLKNNNIPYEYIFSADDKVLFCNMFKIKYLIDDTNYNILYAPNFGINTFFPINKKNRGCETTAYGFKSWDELYNKFAAVS